MKRLVIVIGLLCLFSGTAEAGVSDWPVVGQVIRVASCVVGGTGQLVGSLLTHLTNWGKEAITTVGQCALHTASEVTDVAGDVVTLTVPTPDPQ